ncbi:30234_t:CDS:2, partial [Racocetra persica]
PNNSSCSSCESIPKNLLEKDSHSAESKTNLFHLTEVRERLNDIYREVAI